MDVVKVSVSDSDDVKNLDFHPAADTQKLESALKKLGRLSKDFDASFLIDLLDHASPKIRFLAYKNIGKTKNIDLLPAISLHAFKELDTLARREAVSALGRMKSSLAIPILLEFLNDEDSKIVMQAVRALHPFKSLEAVKQGFDKLKSHPNETIQSSLQILKTKNTIDVNHRFSSDKLKNVLVFADTHDVISYISDESIHLTFTSPPYYNAKDYSLYRSYQEYLEFLTDIFKQVHRITKEGRFLVLNTSPVLIPRVSRKHASKRCM